ncbi:MAG: hypothetical protein A3I66_21375 [Burkholderiales bacterium RIFCSPLOWO2_02_FULL_57_36]|nr:MAG: hypothetical protein A3I66_21375 [Burkholderiales bacterium RIFCSPLOWO2_02_FULL_57_36]
MESFQIQFHRRWRHLNDPHVRALAWLLDAPDLLDPTAPQWRRQIATLDAAAGKHAEDWLCALDRAPDELHAYLNLQPFSRLGRYAEKLMAFYFRHRGILVAHGVQVCDGKNGTVGEFDFLLQDGTELIHWEFATKFYLLESTGAGKEADYFVGPNLADTLGAKMCKILDRQLSLAQHSAAQIHLSQPIASAQALVKGWLFYHENDAAPTRSLGVSGAHCRGFWCTLAELGEVPGARYSVLPRLRWLAPAKLDWDQTLDRLSLQEALSGYFSHDTMPVMVAIVARDGNHAVEMDRGFIVPDDWRIRAGQRVRRVAAAGDPAG